MVHMMDKCKFKDTFDCCIVSKDMADCILNRIGFGRQKCAETNQYDGRYGYWDDHEQALKYGFHDMHGVIREERIIVFDIECPGSKDVYTKSEFEEYFEVIR